MTDTYNQRTIQNYIMQASEQFSAVIVTGARQVGKTTILKNLSEESRTYVTLDDPAMAELAREEPALFLQRFPPPVLIDEVQYAPELLHHIKIWIDREPARKGAFWLTGSQQFHLMQEVSESLAGRIAVVRLLGLSQFEICSIADRHEAFLPVKEVIETRKEAIGFANEIASQVGAMAASSSAEVAMLAANVLSNPTAVSEMLEVSTRAASYNSVQSVILKSIYERIWTGSYPALALQKNVDSSMRDLFYGSYVQTYLERDVRNLANVDDERTFFKFLRAAAARTGQRINLSNIANDTGVSVDTVKRWLSILESSGIIYILEPYNNSMSKRLSKTPKLYFLDTGLCAYLTEWTTPETLEAGAMSGAILETFVITEILKSYVHNGRRAYFYYYYDKDMKEIDLLIVQDGNIYPIEVKKTASPTKQDCKQFATLERFDKIVADGAVICLCETYLPIRENVTAIPVSWV